MDKIQLLYKQLKDDGFKLDEEKAFMQDLQDDASFRRQVYDAQKNSGYDMGGDFDAWQRRLMKNFSMNGNRQSQAGSHARQVAQEYDESVRLNSGRPAPVQTAPAAKGTAALPDGFGRLDTSDFTRNGGMYRAGWNEKPDLFDGPTAVEQTVRALNGDRKAMREMKSVMDSMNAQLRDRLDYANATGKELKDPVVDMTQFGVAPSLDRFESGDLRMVDGKPVVGHVNDEVRAGTQRIDSERLRRADLRRQLEEAEKELAALHKEADNISIPDYIYWQDALSPFADPRTTNGDLASLSTAMKQTQERIDGLKRQLDGGNTSIMRGIADGLGDVDTWTLGLTSLGENMNMARVAKQIRDGHEADSADALMIEAIMKNGDVQQSLEESSSMGYRGARMFGQMLPFMGQIMATGGFSGVANLGSAAGRKWAADYIKKHGAEAFRNRMAAGMLKGTGIALGDIAAGFANATTLGIGNTLNDALQRYTGHASVDDQGNYTFTDGDELWRALGKAAVSQTKEFATERFGEHLPGLSRIAGSIGRLPRMSAVSRAMSGLAGNKVMRKTAERLRKGGVNGLGSEIIEEEIGLPIDVAIGDMTWEEALSGRTQGDIVLGLAMSVGAMQGIGAAAQGMGRLYDTAQYRRYGKRTDKAGKAAASTLADGAWAPLKEKIDSTPNEGFGEVWDEVRADVNLSEREKRAVYDYMNSLAAMRGYALGALNSAREKARRRVEFEDLQPTGRGEFGDEYDQFKGNAADAAAFLVSKRGGLAKGVFHRDDVGDVDLAWGNPRGGLEHIIEKHVITYADFNSVDEAMDGIEDVLKDGKKSVQKNGNYAIDKDGCRVILSKAQNGHFIVTAYDSSRKMEEKKRSDADATRLRQSIFNNENGTPVSQSTASAGKDSSFPGHGQEIGAENDLLTPAERENVHEDGMIHTAMMYANAENGGQPEEVFVVRGNLAMGPDGHVDVEASDDVIYYKGADGQVHSASPDKFESAAEPLGIEEYAAARATGSDVEPVGADAQSAPFAIGQEVSVIIDGKARPAMVQGVDGNGNVSVYYQDADGMARPAVFTEEELRGMAGVNEPGKPNAPWMEETEVDENGRAFVKSANGTTIFGEIRENSGLTPAPIKLSEGYQDENGKGYGLAHIEASHGSQIRQAGFASVESFVSFVAANYDEDNIRVGKRRENGSPTYLIQVTDTHDNTLFIEMSKDGAYWNVNSAGIFRRGYSNKKETVAKTEPQRPNNAISTGSSLSENEESGITSPEPNGEPTVSESKDSANNRYLQGNGQENAETLQEPLQADASGASARGGMPTKNKANDGQEHEYTLSDKKAGNGEHFYQRGDGNVNLAEIPKEIFDSIGYTAAPFRLTPSMIQHTIDRHGKETGILTEQEAINFVMDVMTNFDHVRLGYDGALVFSIENGRNRTGKRAVTVLINSDNGEFYGLKTSGYESIRGLEKRPLLWERGANEKASATDAASASVTTGKSPISGEQSGSASLQSNNLLGKDSTNNRNLQGNGKENAAPLQAGANGASARGRIPVDEKGRVLYHEVPVERTIEDLYDGQLNDEEIRGFVDANINDSEKEYNAVLRKAPKMSTDKAKYVDAKTTWQADVDAARRKADYWRRVKGEVERITHTTEEEMAAARRELSGEASREEYAWPNDGEAAPGSGVELAAYYVSGAKITPESFRKETGFGIGEQRRFVGMIASAANGGKSIERLAEGLVEHDDTYHGGSYFRGDSNAARDAIISALQGAQSRAGLRNIMPDAQREFVERREQEREDFYQEAYHMSFEDYLAFSEQEMPSLLRKYSNFDEQEYLSRYAEEIERNINQGKNDTTREEQRTDRGTEILPREGIGDRGGSRGGQERAGEVQAGRDGSDAYAALQESASRGIAGSDGLRNNERGGTEVRAKARQGDLAQAEIRLSDEIDANGRQFVLTSDGQLAFGEITEKSGLTPAPILLSEGMITNPATNDGYGLVHIEARHGDQIRNAGYKSVVEFIEDVAKNYDRIKEGNVRNGNATYLMQLTDKHNNTLIVELSSDGTYWNINTAGIFKESYGKNRKVVYDRHTTGKQPAETAGASQEAAQSGTPTSPSMNAPTTSESSLRKDTDKSSATQAIGEKVAKAEEETDTNPTEAQKEAGNYKKGHVRIGQFDITVENPKGSVRRGVDASGKAWEQEMRNTYGYIRGTEGVDGDHIDVFLTNDIDGWNGRRVYIVDQYNEDGTFDEHKVMLGFNDEAEAQDAYLSNYEKGWSFKHKLVLSSVNLPDFEKWINSSHRKTKPFAEYKSVSRENDGNRVTTGKNDLAARVREILREILKPKMVEAVSSDGDLTALASVLPSMTISKVRQAIKDGAIGYYDSESDVVFIISDRVSGNVDVRRLIYHEHVHSALSALGVNIDDALAALREERPDLLAEAMRRVDNTALYDDIDADVRNEEILVYAIDHLVADGVVMAGDGKFTEIYNNIFNALRNGKDKSLVRGATRPAQENRASAVQPVREPGGHGQGKSLGVAGEVESGGSRPLDFGGRRESEFKTLRNGKEESIVHRATPQSSEKNSTSSIQPIREPESYGQGESLGVAGEADFGRSLPTNDRGRRESQGKRGEATYSIEPAQYTTKRGKVLGMFLVTFAEPLSQEQQRAAREIAKSEKGWYDRDKGGFMMRSEESAQQLANTITGNEEAVSDAQPLSIADTRNLEDFKAARESVVQSTVEDLQDEYATANLSKTEEEIRKEAEELVDYNEESDLYMEVWDRLEHLVGAESMDELEADARKKGEDRLSLATMIDEIEQLGKREQEEAAKVKQQSGPIEKIEDVGEKIGGAKKDRFKEFVEKEKQIREKPESFMEELRKLPASKIFNFNLEALRKDGLSNEAATLIDVIRRVIPSKPRTDWKLKRWVSDVFGLYRFCLTLATAEQGTFDNVLERVTNIKQIGGIYRAQMALGGFDSELDTGRATLEELGDSAGHYDKDNNWVSIKGQWYVTHAGRYSGIYPDYEKAKEALDKFAGENSKPKEKSSEVKFSVYSYKHSGQSFITLKGKPGIVVESGFKSSKEALDYLNEHMDELQAKYRNMKDTTSIGFSPNRERKGKDWRGGMDVTAEDFRTTFGFRGVEFGNWTNQQERQHALNQAYDAFMDLSEATGISPRGLSLGGELGMAFGARGGGGAAAHYEPGKVVINLTKTQGAGSLAHEWWHAVDNYFSRRRGQALGYNTERKGYNLPVRGGKVKFESEAERKEVTNAFAALMKAINGSSYGERSNAYANLKSSYWKEPTELGARAFAVWVERKLSEKGIVNNFLANNNVIGWESPELTQKYFPYPLESDFESLDVAFDNLFGSIEEKVDEDTGNTILYREADDELSRVNERFNEQLDGLTETNADKVVLSLGKPSAILRAAGVEDKLMKLYGNKVIKKMKKHGFTLDELHNLPEAVASPIAVFNNYQKDGNRSILTELAIGNKNVLVSITVGQGNDVDFNIVSYVFGKGKSNIIDWINKGYATYINKKKTLDYLHFSERSIPEASNSRDGKALNYLHHSALSAEALSSPRLVSAAKIVKNFENPSVEEENLRIDNGALTDDDLSIANDPVSKLTGKSSRTAQQRRAFAERERERMVERVRELAEALHLDNVDIVTDASTLQGNRAKAKGFFSRSTGRITIVIPNQTSVFDAEQTLLHEAVAHYGLRQLFGEHFDTFLDNVFQNADTDVRRHIVELAGRRGWNFRTATEEYLASLAENTNFENVNASWWSKIKELFLRMLHKIGFEDFSGVTLSDNELRYILWRSYENLAEPGRYRSILGTARDIARQHELGVGNYAAGAANVQAEAAAEMAGEPGVEEANRRFNDELDAFENGKMRSSDKFSLGKPSKILLATGLPNSEIGMTQSVLRTHLKKHGLKAQDLQGLPIALQHPIMVYEWGDKAKSAVVITDMELPDGRRITIAIKVAKNGVRLSVNEIASVHGKDLGRLLTEMNTNKTNFGKDNLKYVDKDKALHWFAMASPLEASQTDTRLVSAAKIVKNFENPSVEDENISTTADMAGEPSVEEANRRFNEELDEFNEKRHKGLLHIGKPGPILKACGIDAELTLSPSVLSRKLKQHKLSVDDIKGLAGAVQKPILVYQHGDVHPNIVIVTDLTAKGGKVSVAVELDADGNVVELNNISSVHSKEASRELERLSDMRDGYLEQALRWVDKKKVSDWLGIADLNSPIHANNPKLVSAAKIIRNFENPSVEDENVLFRDGNSADATKTSPEESTIRAWDKIANSVKFQLTETGFDYLNAVDKFQKLISKRSGKPVTDFENAYDAMTFLSSKNRQEMDMFDSFILSPLNKAIIGLVGRRAGRRKNWQWEKGPLRELVMYVEAKHGTERNRQMAVEAVAKADPQNADAIMARWNEAKKQVAGQSGTGWAERQRQLDEAAASLGADLSEDYSGLSSVFNDAEKYPQGWSQAALDYVEGYELSHPVKAIDDLWRAIGNATGFTLQKQLETGLVSREYVERQKERFEHYIPLRGFEDDTAGDVYNYLGQDYYPGSNPVKTAHGRTSEPGNPFGSILNTAYASISSGNKNVAKTAFYTLVMNHDTGGLAVARRAWMVKYDELKSNPELERLVAVPKLDNDEEIPEWIEAVPRIPEDTAEKKVSAEEISKVLGDFESAMRKYEKAEATKPINKKAKIAYRTLHNERNEHEIPLFIGGSKYIVTITGNSRVAQAMNGLLNPDSGDGKDLIKEYAKRTQRFMSGAFTAKNPAFSLANLSKDTMYANNQAFIRENPKYWLLFTKNQRLGFGDFGPMMRRLHRYRQGKLSMESKDDRLFKEFMDNGGATGYTFVNTQEEYARELEKKLRELSRGKARWFTPKEAGKLLFDCFEFAGQSAELVNRFAAYKTSREMGRSINRGIRDAKEITVNFNRKGAGRKTASKNNSAIVNLAAAVSQYGRTYILFWNANMQAKYRFFKNLQEHPVKTGVTLIANNMALAAIVIPMLNNVVLPALYAAFGDGDGDDGEEREDYFNALTDYERTHNICIRLPRGYWLKIPLSPEMSAWYSIGDAVGGAASGQTDLQASDFIQPAIDAASPLSINWSYGADWKFALNFLPTVGQPVAQNMMNVNFMGNPIKKTPFGAKQGKKPQYTMVYRSASPTLIELSRLSNRLAGGEDDKTAGAADWNPAMVQNLISGYTGGFGTTLLSAADWMVNTAKGERQAVTFSRMPLVSRFAISGDKDMQLRRINSRFYSVKDFVADFEYDMDRYGKRVENGLKEHDSLKVAAGMAEYDKLLKSERAAKYNELNEIADSADAYEDYLKEFPGDEATKNLLYQIKLRGIELLHGDARPR